jgi:hypothetical protein
LDRLLDCKMNDLIRSLDAIERQVDVIRRVVSPNRLAPVFGRLDIAQWTTLD